MKTELIINMQERKEQLDETYQKLLEVGFGNGSIEESPKFMDENVMGYGTALDEKIMSYNDFRELIVVQRKQAANFDDFIYQSNPVIKRLFNEGSSALIVDEIDLTSVIDGENNKMTVRMSTMLEFNKESWKVVHWHGSLAEHVSDGEDPWHVNEWKQKTAELQKLVDEKTVDLLNKNRELEIEASLERVRAVAMGMSKSEDLLGICEVSYHEFEKLGFENLRAVLIHILDDESRTFTDYDYCELFGGEISTLSYDSHPVVVNYFEQIKSRKDAFAEAVLSGDELESWKKVRLETGQKNDPRLNDTDALYYYGYSIGFGDFSISTLKPIVEIQIRILKRFRNVFDLAYRRFIDIEKAEAQAREAKIEAALEKVRSRTMAMQKGQELKEVAVLLYKELIALGVTNFVTCGYVEIHEKINKQYTWVTAPGGDKLGLFYLPLTGDATFNERYAAWKRQQLIFHQTVEGEERSKHLEYAITTFQSKEAEEMVRNQFPDPTVFYCFNFSHGYLHIVTGSQLNHEEEILVARFTKVFEQTYTRFLDLKKAEAQAREAQIELSLERIRAQITAMRESSELLDIVVTMRSEFVALGHEAHYFWHMRWLPDKYEKAMTNSDGTRIGMVMSLPRHIHGDIAPVAEWEKSDQPIYVLAMDVETAVEYVDKMIALGDFELVDPQAPSLNDIRHIGGLTFIMARTTHGEIGFSLPGTVPDPPKDALDTLVRFAVVFDLAYKRFEDLKSAEHRHREAQIELALERVRSKSMAMHQSDELADLSLELVKQVHALGVDTWFCAFNIYDDDQQGSLEWGSNGQGTFPQYRTPREGIFLRYYEAGQRGEKLFVYEINENECPAHYDYLCSLPGVGEQLLKMKEAGIPFPVSQIDHVAFFKYGYILFITFEPVPESHEIFKRFAKVFEQTYTRFLDLQKSEEQRKIIQAENDRKTEELEEARQLQLAMLPKELPKLAKLDIAVYMETATEVGGDYYDFSTKDNGSLNVCLGDATGHGLKAGTLVSIMKSLFISDSVKLDLRHFFVSANETLKKMSLSQMMMAFAMVNIYGQKIKIANAGIPSIYIYRKNKNEVEEVNVNGMPIGAMKNSKYEIYENEVATGDTILMLSDGFPELQNTSDEMYGYERLKSVFKQNGNKTSKEIITVLENESKIWSAKREQDDDVTFVVVKVK